MKRVALRGLLGAQAPLGADRGRDRPRRRDGQRHARPHRHDRRRRSTRSSRARTSRPTRSSSGKKLVEWSQTGKAPGLRGRAREGARAARGRGRAPARSSTSPATRTRRRSSTATGKAIQGNNPTFGLGVEPARRALQPVQARRGRLGHRAGQVVIDVNTADEHGFRVGDPSRSPAKARSRSFTLAGIARFGDVDSLGGATIALFDVATARTVLAKDGFDAIAVARERRRRPERADRRDRHHAAPPRPRCAPASSRRRRTARASASSSRSSATSCSRFGGIALFVGAFVIFNTLSITVAQRTKELATLRTLGASRRQVLRSVILEGTILGVVASAVGLGLGVLLAKGLTELFAALDLELPQSSLVFQTRTAVVAMLTGTLRDARRLGLAGGARNADRADLGRARRRHGRQEAVAEDARLRRSSSRACRCSGSSTARLARASRRACASSGSPAAPSASSSASRRSHRGSFARSHTSSASLPRAWAARPAGWPRRTRSATPARTASTAAALMIGLTLVSFVAVFGKGLLASDENALRKQLGTSHVITSQSGWDTVPARSRRSGRWRAGRHARVVDPRRPGAARRRRRGRRQRRRPGHDRAGVQVRVDRGLRRLAGGARARRRDRPRGHRTARVGDTVVYRIALTPAGKDVATVVRGVYKKHGDLDQLLGQHRRSRRRRSTARSRGRATCSRS